MMGPRHWNIFYHALIIGTGIPSFEKALVNYIAGAPPNFHNQKEQSLWSYLYLMVPVGAILAVMVKSRALFIVPMIFTTVFTLWMLGHSGYNFFNRLDYVAKWAWYRRLVVPPFVLSILNFILWCFVFRKSLTLLRMWKCGFSGDETNADLTQIRPMLEQKDDGDEDDDDDDIIIVDIEADNYENLKKYSLYNEPSVGNLSTLTQGSDSIRGYAVYKKHGWSLQTNLRRSSSPPLPRTLRSSKDNNGLSNKVPTPLHKKQGQVISTSTRPSSSTHASLENGNGLNNSFSSNGTFPRSGSLHPSENPIILKPESGILKPELKSTTIPCFKQLAQKLKEESEMDIPDEKLKTDKEIRREETKTVTTGTSDNKEEMKSITSTISDNKEETKSISTIPSTEI